MRSPSPDNTLSSAEVEHLNRLEAIVQRALDADVEVGNAFANIDDAWLYRGTHQTFEAYLRDRWGITRSRGYQLIEALKEQTDRLRTQTRRHPGQNWRPASCLRGCVCC